MRIKTDKLTGAALDWAVAKCEGFNAEALVELAKRVPGKNYGCFLKKYSTDWAQGGPIIDREQIGTQATGGSRAKPTWEAKYWDEDTASVQSLYGPTPLIAAMRCYVASKMGATVEIPEELV